MDNVLFFIFLAIPITIKGNMYKGYLGCFGDSKDNRVLNGTKKFIAQNGPKICADYCIKKGYRYAGTQHGQLCFCGNEIRYKDESDECNTPCRTNPREKCGGFWKLSLYDTWSLDEDNGSSINLMYIIIPCCVVVVLIAFIIGVIIYYRRKKSRGNNNNEIELQKHENSKQTANDEEEYNTIDEENTVSNQNQLDDPTTEGDYTDVDNQAAAASVVEDDEYNILSLKGTHVGPVKKGLNTGQGTLSNNTYSHLHELYPSTDDTYSHTNSNYPNKISNTQDNIYDHTSQGMIQASNMELDNTYNTLTLPNTKGMEQTSAADLAVHREDDVDLYNSVEEPVLKQANIDLDDYSHLADFDINN